MFHVRNIMFMFCRLCCLSKVWRSY
jgi:hypothetical protein